MGSPYAERGGITDEALTVMKALWTQDGPAFCREIPPLLGHALFSETATKAPYPPVDWREQPCRYPSGGAPGQWLAPVRRIARGVVPGHWLPAGAGPEELAGRDSAEIPVSLSIPGVNPNGPWTRVGHRPGRGIVQKVQAYASVGVQMIVIPGHTGDMAEILLMMDMLAQRVLPVFQ